MVLSYVYKKYFLNLIFIQVPYWWNCERLILKILFKSVPYLFPSGKLKTRNKWMILKTSLVVLNLFRNLDVRNDFNPKKTVHYPSPYFHYLVSVRFLTFYAFNYDSIIFLLLNSFDWKIGTSKEIPNKWIIYYTYVVLLYFIVNYIWGQTTM